MQLHMILVEMSGNRNSEHFLWAGECLETGRVREAFWSKDMREFAVCHFIDPRSKRLWDSTFFDEM